MTDLRGRGHLPLSGITAPPSISSASSLNDRRVIPVVRRFLVDDQTPVGRTQPALDAQAPSCWSRRRTGRPGAGTHSSGA